MDKAGIDSIFRTFAKLNPHPKGELKAPNPYTLLVAIVLSAQATDKSVNAATPPLFAKVKTPAAMVKLGEEGLLPYIKSIGLYRTKGKNIINLSRQLIERFDGDVPNDQEALESLPGVGRKTANVLRNIAFDEPTVAVDTHVFRVANRTGLAAGKTPVDVEKALIRRVPKKYHLHLHHWLILHGRYICTARKPQCPTCPIRRWCQYPGRGQ